MTKSLTVAEIKPYINAADLEKINKQNKKEQRLKMMKFASLLGLAGVAVGVPMSHNTIQPTQLAQTKELSDA